MKKDKFNAVEKICAGIHVFCGVGGMAGGFAAISDPVNPLGVPVSVLANSPFTDFFIPGILLFSVIGVGNLIAAASFFTRLKIRPFVSGFFASALIIWLAVQCFMLQAIEALHVIFFIIGAVQGLLALLLIMKESAE